ncbi:MAG: hypothetical protein AAGN35_07635 [Bacteroidota bacterium]
MEGSKLVQLLRSLDYRERARLKKFVVSPFFNENEEVARLLALLMTVVPASREAAWRELFPERPFADLRMRHLMSDLMRLTERFLAVCEAERRPVQMQLHLLRALGRRPAPRLYEFVWRKADRKRGKFPLGSEALLEQFQLQAEYDSFLENRANRSGITNLQRTIDDLDTFYLFSKLKYTCNVLNNQRVMDVGGDHSLLDGLLDHLAQSDLSSHPGIAIYYRIYRMLTDPKESAHYFALKALLEAHAANFAPEEARDMYSFALNFCIGKINQGDSEYLREIFGLYRAGLAGQVMLEQGRLSPWDYKNIVVVALRLGEFSWAEQFIRQYKEHIAAEHRANAFTYNLAKLFFYRKEYGEVLKLLQKVEYEDVFYNLDSKVMLLKIYYELAETEALDSLLESFRTYLRRNRLISDPHRTNYLNLIRFVRRLSRLRPNDQARLQQIRADVAQCQQLADANWLWEKLADGVG